MDVVDGACDVIAWACACIIATLLAIALLVACAAILAIPLSLAALLVGAVVWLWNQIL